jgi:hypothetical protein
MLDLVRIDPLIAWAAAFAIIRGVRDIVLAFRVRELQHTAHA